MDRESHFEAGDVAAGVYSVREFGEVVTAPEVVFVALPADKGRDGYQCYTNQFG
jgi:hypothetical protein